MEKLAIYTATISFGCTSSTYNNTKAVGIAPIQALGIIYKGTSYISGPVKTL